MHWERELKIIIAEAEDVTSEIDRQLRGIKKIIENHPLKVLSKFRWELLTLKLYYKFILHDCIIYIVYATGN